MKENRKLLKEVLKDIRHDMTNDEVLNLLADSKISVNPESAKENIHLVSAQRIPLQNSPAAGHSSFALRVYSFSGWSSILFLAF